MNPPMNIRAKLENTPERRITAVLRTLITQKIYPPPDNLDYADIENRIAPYLELELLRARVEETEHSLASKDFALDAPRYLLARVIEMQRVIALLQKRINEIEARP
jgi:hypothetical protein